LDFFDDEDDDAPESDQPTRESRSVPPPEAESRAEAEPRAQRQRRARPRPAGSRSPRRPNRSFDDAPVPGDSGAGAGGGNVSRQQIRSRQLTLLGVTIVVLILLFLAFRGCLNARKERSFENYVNDLSALTAETKQLSDNFFSAFEGGSEDGGDLSLTNQIAADRGASQGLLDRAESLDAPGELSSAQNQISLAYQLRRDALEVIAAEIPQAQGEKGDKAIEKIAEQMRVLLASDILFSRARFEIEQALANQDIVVDDGVPDSVFLPKTPDFLDEATVSSALSESGVSSADCDNPNPDELHGLELSSTTVQPAGVVLQPTDTGTENVVGADSAEFEIAVLNGGDFDENDIDVTIDGDFTGSQTIDSVAALDTATVTIPPKPAPASGDTGSITVTVATVCGETLDSNNESTYDITFE
jgi:hypothetical protein